MITDKEVIDAMGKLKDYCANRDCGTCVLYNPSIKNGTFCIPKQSNPTAYPIVVKTSYELEVK